MRAGEVGGRVDGRAQPTGTGARNLNPRDMSQVREGVARARERGSTGGSEPPRHGATTPEGGEGPEAGRAACEEHRMCSGCSEVRPRAAYSRRQWQHVAEDTRRCVT